MGDQFAALQFELLLQLLAILSSNYTFQVTIKSCEIRDSRFNVGSFIKYKIDGDEEYTVTPTVTKSLAPEFNHSRVIKIDKVIFPMISADCLFS